MTRISKLDFLILDEIRKRGMNTVSQIGKDLNTTQPLISQHIQKFYDAQFVNYETRKNNRSMKWYFLTDKGKLFLESSRSLWEEQIE